MGSRNRSVISIVILVVALLVWVLAADPGAVASAQTAGIDWNARLNELGAAAPDETVLTAIGDAIWIRKVSTIKEDGLQAVFNVMRTADVAFLNLEEALADRGYPKLKAVAKADPSIADEFYWAGIDVVAAANNHFMDYGPSGIDIARTTLDTKGIAYTGAGHNLAEALEPAIVEGNGIRMAFLAFMMSPNMGPSLAPPAGPDEPGVAPIRGAEIRLPDGKVVRSPWAQDLEAMEGAIRKAKEAADFVAVSYHMHWGPRDEIDPTGKQLVARTAIDAGADLILGHGPHILNGIEIYKGKPILYSMGHFFLHLPLPAYDLFPDIQRVVQGVYASDRFSESVLVRTILGPTGQIRRLELLPVELSKEGDPYFASGEMTDKIFDRFSSLSEPLGTKISRESWYLVVELPES